MNSYQTFKSGPRAGQPRTLHDRVVRYLVEHSKLKEVPSPSKKYRMFTIPGKPGYNYYVGKAGAIRFGEIIGRSSSITDQIMVYIEEWERRLQAVVDKCNRTLERQELEAAEADGLINNLDGVIHN